MMDRLARFFKRFTSPNVSEKEAYGAKHVIDNIDRNFDSERPTPDNHGPDSHGHDHKQG